MCVLCAERVCVGTKLLFPMYGFFDFFFYRTQAIFRSACTQDQESHNRNRAERIIIIWFSSAKTRGSHTPNLRTPDPPAQTGPRCILLSYHPGRALLFPVVWR